MAGEDLTPPPTHPHVIFLLEDIFFNHNGKTHFWRLVFVVSYACFRKKCDFPKFFLNILTLVIVGGHNYPLLEGCDFSTTEHPIDLRPVSKFEFACCGPVENKHN